MGMWVPASWTQGKRGVRVVVVSEGWKQRRGRLLEVGERWKQRRGRMLVDVEDGAVQRQKGVVGGVVGCMGG